MFDADISMKIEALGCTDEIGSREVLSPEGLCAFAADIIGIKAEIAKHPRVEQGEIVTL
jgi:hypothetical protein